MVHLLANLARTVAGYVTFRNESFEFCGAASRFTGFFAGCLSQVRASKLLPLSLK